MQVRHTYEQLILDRFENGDDNALDETVVFNWATKDFLQSLAKNVSSQHKPWH